jgi:GntR family transcriptional regulator / MocR family aminotransferase
VLLKLEGEGPLYQRLYRALRGAILDGRFPAGARLPSTRDLAADLALSRNLVLIAFEQLMGEGYVEGRTGSGTYVSATLPDAALLPWSPRPAERRPARRPRLARHARCVWGLSPLPPPGAPLRQGLRYDFRYGLPSVADFPAETWSRLVSRRNRAVSLRSLRYGRVAGFPPLREAIAQYLTRARGVVATPEQVLVVNGTQQALDLVTRLFVNPGDRVVVEEPGYEMARLTFRAAGARLVPVRVDREGLDTSRLPRRAGVRLAYVTPSHQFPLGGILPSSRRRELLRWAEATGAHIVEDDYDSEFRYEGRPVQAVQGLDRSGRVLYVGTFSKVLFPSLRIGYLVVPEPLVEVAKAVRFLIDYHTPTLEQEVLAEFIAGGHFERHLRRSRARNAARRATLLEALRDELGDEVEIAGEKAGIHVVAWLRDFAPARVEDLRRRAAERDVGIYSIRPYYLRPPRRAGLLFGYAYPTERDIREGVKILREILASRRRSVPSHRAIG